MSGGDNQIVFRPEQGEREDHPSQEPQKAKILFQPTHEWQEIFSYHICPAGLEFRMELQTGQSFGRLVRKY